MPTSGLSVWAEAAAAPSAALSKKTRARPVMRGAERIAATIR